MIGANKFAIIGGDKRQFYLAKSMLKDKHDITFSGFDKIDIQENLNQFSLQEATIQNKYIILPVPTTKDSKILNAPYSSVKIELNDNFAKMFLGKKIFCGVKEKLLKTSEIWHSIEIYDYAKREDFKIKNAIPTSEGAIQIAMQEYLGTISGSKCLIMGFGRIGKLLSKMLWSLNADITVSARKISDLSLIEAFGYKSLKTLELNKTFDIIFNTIPYMIIDKNFLNLLDKNTLIIDIASAPGGIDLQTAKSLGIKTIQALGLPGKVAPKTSGNIIKETIYNIIKENSL